MDTSTVAAGPAAANDGHALIAVEDYHKSYRETVAVAGLSFRVDAGQILGLVGPNGAGKTTTLRAIAGIIPPTRGRLLVAGHDVAADPVAAKRRFAYVPDDPKLFDMLTIWEHLQFIAAAYQVADFQREATRLIEQFDLTEKKGTVAGELSRGMRQKVAICCAYLHDPSAIVFDEPLTGLDPRAMRTLKQTIIARAGAGAAVIISSHLLALVQDLCTHLLIMDRGSQRFCGPIGEARKMFDDLSGDASLEQIFFRATEGGIATAPLEPSSPPPSPDEEAPH